MSITAEAAHASSNENLRDPSRSRSAGDVVAVTIEAMDEPTAATELDSADGAPARAETIGQLGAQFAHDFNNVLAHL